MKKTLKLTSLLFTLILAVSVVFTGCGNGRKDSTTKGTTENNNASGTTEDNLVDDAEDAVDDVADGVGDAVDDIANGFDNYDDAHDYLLNRLQNDDKDGKYEVRNETKDEQEYRDGASGYHFEIYDTSDDSGKKYGDFYVDKDTGKIYKRINKTLLSKINYILLSGLLTADFYIVAFVCLKNFIAFLIACFNNVYVYWLCPSNLISSIF